jgi:hypothetical protein
METLRIRIPQIYSCSSEDCFRLTRFPKCSFCSNPYLATRMRQEMTPATFPRKTQVVHSPPLSGFLSGRG